MKLLGIGCEDGIWTALTTGLGVRMAFCRCSLVSAGGDGYFGLGLRMLNNYFGNLIGVMEGISFRVLILQALSYDNTSVVIRKDQHSESKLQKLYDTKVERWAQGDLYVTYPSEKNSFQLYPVSDHLISSATQSPTHRPLSESRFWTASSPASSTPHTYY